METEMAAPKLPPDQQSEEIHVLTEAESWEMFEQRAQYFLGISGKEFLRRWRDGEYPDPDGTPAMHLVMSLPLIGISPYAPVGNLDAPC
jgi:hypothetical protein